MPKNKTEEKSQEKPKKKSKRKDWDIRQMDFMQALKDTIDEGGNKDDLRAKVIEYSEPYNKRRSPENCTLAKINFQHRKAKELTGKDLKVAPSGSLSPEQKIMWKDAFSDYKQPLTNIEFPAIFVLNKFLSNYEPTYSMTVITVWQFFITENNKNPDTLVLHVSILKKSITV